MSLRERIGMGMLCVLGGGVILWAMYSICVQCGIFALLVPAGVLMYVSLTVWLMSKR